MDFQVTFNISDKIYLRDPESSELGKLIVKNAIDLIYELGFENFTFKKLAIEMNTTEASIYRYFENKHRLLLYIINWYWCYLEFLLVFNLQNIKDPKTKLISIIDLLTKDMPDSSGKTDYSKKLLNQIVIAESSKVYLVKDVDQINKNDVFKPYKDLCAQISLIIKAYNPKYKYALSLSSSIIETSHHQMYFTKHLPRLTDIKNTDYESYVKQFLNNLLFEVLK